MSHKRDFVTQLYRIIKKLHTKAEPAVLSDGLNS